MDKIYLGNSDDASMVYEPVLLEQKELVDNIEKAEKVIDELYDIPWYKWFKKMDRIGLLNQIKNELGTHTTQLRINDINQN